MYFFHKKITRGKPFFLGGGETTRLTPLWFLGVKLQGLLIFVLIIYLFLVKMNFLQKVSRSVDQALGRLKVWRTSVVISLRTLLGGNYPPVPPCPFPPVLPHSFGGETWRSPSHCCSQQLSCPYVSGAGFEPGVPTLECPQLNKPAAKRLSHRAPLVFGDAI